jgi:hypothetical protein
VIGITASLRRQRHTRAPDATANAAIEYTEGQVRVDDINGAVALSLEPGELAASWRRCGEILSSA